jgi:site-specific recombinase XerC
MDRSQRDFAVVALGLFAGLRLAELSAVDVEDVELTDGDGQIAISQRSAGAGQVVPLNAQARAAIGAWLVERSVWRGSETGALLLSRRGLRLSVRAVDLVVRTCGRSAGLQVSTQVLRHTFVDNLYRVGTNVATVAQLAGYHRPETVRRYRPCGLSDAMRAVEAISVDV